MGDLPLPVMFSYAVCDALFSAVAAATVACSSSFWSSSLCPGSWDPSFPFACSLPGVVLPLDGGSVPGVLDLFLTHPGTVADTIIFRVVEDAMVYPPWGGLLLGWLGRGDGSWGVWAGMLGGGPFGGGSCLLPLAGDLGVFLGLDSGECIFHSWIVFFRGLCSCWCSDLPAGGRTPGWGKWGLTSTIARVFFLRVAGRNK